MDGKARAIPVTIHGSSGRLRRIEGAELQPGMKLVVKGTHYVFDGAEVAIAEEEALEAFMEAGR